MVANTVLATKSIRFFRLNANQAGSKNPVLVRIKPQNGICFRPIQVEEMSVTDSTSPPRILGEGSFGCVLKPPVKCASKETIIKKTSGKTVGKIFSDKVDFRVEVDASKKIAKIDRKGSHILVPTSYCKTTKGAVEMHPAADGCEMMQSRWAYPASLPMYQLVMPYGGQRYDKYLRLNTVDMHTFIQHVIHMLEGVLKLQRHGICHQDLKASNLLITDTGTVLIIDYSLMMPFADIYSKKNLRRLYHSYFPYPPEYKIFYLVYKHICEGKDCDMALPQVMKNLEHYGERKLELMQKLHGNMEESVAALYKETSKIKDKLPTAFHKYAKKVDVYSIGAIMVDMDKYVTKYGVSKAEMRKYYEVMKGMTMIHPKERLTVMQALKKLRAISK